MYIVITLSNQNCITCTCAQAPPKSVKPLTSSRTLDSLVELQSTKINTPSMSSSGYGSQAVSTTNLTSEDSISIKSISVDETPDLEYRNLLDSKKSEKMDSSLVEETPEEYLSEVNSTLDNLNISQSTRTEGQLSQMQNNYFRCRHILFCCKYIFLSYRTY